MRKIGLVALLLMLCISGAAFAQGSDQVFCGDLPQADCDLLTNSQAAMNSLDSVHFGLTVNFSATNVPDMTDPVAFTLMADGAVSGVADLHGNASLMQTDPGSYITNVLQNLAADLTLTLLLPPEMMQEMDASLPDNITVQLRLVDGVGYLNLDSLQPILNEPSLSGWGGIDLAGLFQALLQQSPDLFNNMGTGMNSMSMAQQFNDPEFLSRFMHIEKVDVGMPDETTFRITLDFATLMSSPEFQDLMRQQMQAQGQTMTDEDMNQAMAMTSQMFKGMTFTADETIGTNDFYVRSIHGTFSFDTTGMMKMQSNGTGSSSASSTEAAPNVTVDFTLIYNSFNSVPPITAPEDAMILPFQSLLGMIPSTPVATIAPVNPTATRPATTAEPTSEATVEPTSEATMEPTSEVTMQPTAEVTSEPPIGVTTEPTAEATAGS